MFQATATYAMPALMLTGLIAGIVGTPSPAMAQNCSYYAGQAVGGQSINVELCSISKASTRSMDFVYYLGNERVQSQANCQAGTWTTFPERQVNRPKSAATQRMLDIVCSYREQGDFNNIVTVFDPPSNVRTAPNGAILCSISEYQTIHTYGSTGPWYYTDACGKMGVIHVSQIRF